MSSVTLTATTRQNLLSLQDTANLLSTTQNRLSTGKKVNSALDNPTNFFTSQSLTSRSSDLAGLLDGLSNGVQTVQAANQGITSLQKLVDSAKSTAQQALADKSGAKGTVLGGAPAQAATAGGTATLASLSAADGTFDLSDLAKDASIDISVDGGVTKSTLRLDSSTLKSVTNDPSKVTSEQLVTAINNQIASAANLQDKATGLAAVKASIGTNGRLSFTTTASGAESKLSVTASANSTVDVGFGVATGANSAVLTSSKPLAAADINFTGGASTSFTVSDGTTNVTVSLDKDSATDLLGGKLAPLNGSSVNQATKEGVRDAINLQLSSKGSSLVASLGGTNNDQLVFTSKDKGPDAQISVKGLTNNLPSSNGLGFSTFAAGGTTQSVPALGSKTTTVVGTTGNFKDLTAAAFNLAGGQSASFSVKDGGGTAINITLDKTSLDTAGANPSDPATGAVLGDAPTGQKIVDAINAQLNAAGSGVLASIDSTSKALKFTAAANGATALVVAATNDTIGLGLGTYGGSFNASGTGQAPASVTAVGIDATDGSSKASITGSSIPSALYNTSTKAFDLTGKNASFTLQLGSGPSKTIDLSSTTLIDSKTPATALGVAPTQDKVLEAINFQISQDTGLSGKVKASFVNDKLTIQTTSVGSAQVLNIKAAGTDDIGFGTATNAVTKTSTGTDIGGAKGDSSTRSTLAAQYNSLLSQISQQAQDSGFNGVNLLFRNGSNANENTLRLTFNEKGTSTLDITGVKFDADGLGLKSIAGNFQTDEEVNTALNALTTATSSLRAQASTFGSNLSVVQNRQDFSKNMINILDTGSANLVNADLNEEAANSQALSTRNSIATSALSLANQAQQGILQLLR